MKILAVDLDNTLAHSNAVTLDIVNERLGTNYTLEDITHYDKFKEWLGEAEMWTTFREAWVNRWDRIEPVDLRMVPALVQALGMGYEISIITNAQRDNITNATKWLARYGVPYGSIIALHRGQSKFNYPWHVLIDDNPGLEAEAKLYPERRVYIMDHPWNKSVKTLPKVCTFDQLVQEL